MLRFLTYLLILVFLGFTAYGEEEVRSAGRTLQDTLEGLERLVKVGRLSFEQQRDVNEAIADLRRQMIKKSLSEEEAEYIGRLRELMIEKANAEQKNRQAQLSAARFLLFGCEPDLALRYLSTAKPGSDQDLEWRQLVTAAYIQLGDFKRAASFSGEVDALLKERTPLVLSTPVAVSSVTAYRLYQPRGPSGIKPGENLILYLEVGGAEFKEFKKTDYRCNLEFSLELRDDLQRVVDRNENYGSYNPSYVGAVRDLHATLYYRVPANLAKGKYCLIVAARDVYANTVSEADFYFQVGATGGPVIPKKLQTEKKVDAALYLGKDGSGMDMMRKLQDTGMEAGYPELDDGANTLLYDYAKKKNLSAEDMQKIEDAKAKGMQMKLERSKANGSLMKE